MKKEWTITIPNPLALWLVRRRAAKAARKWNADLGRIRSDAAGTPDGEFKWGQLVWQEITMYTRLGEQVQPAEFEHLCERRGFTPAMRGYLREMLAHIGLDRQLDAADSQERYT